jgi:hypothetical protein
VLQKKTISFRWLLMSMFYTLVAFLLVKITIESKISSYFTFPIMSIVFVGLGIFYIWVNIKFLRGMWIVPIVTPFLYLIFTILGALGWAWILPPKGEGNDLSSLDLIFKHFLVILLCCLLSAYFLYRIEKGKIQFRKAVQSSIAIFFILMVSVIGWLTYQRWDSEYSISEEQIQMKIPRSVEIMETYDTHGGFLGDGEFYIVVQFNKEQMNEFRKNALESGKWKPMPLSYDIQKVSHWFNEGDKPRKYSMPINSNNSLYYFRDFQLENSREGNHNDQLKKPVWDRSSVNFAVAILDSDNNRLYIVREDS